MKKIFIYASFFLLALSSIAQANGFVPFSANFTDGSYHSLSSPSESDTEI